MLNVLNNEKRPDYNPAIKRSGYSLIEVLCTTAIVGVLIALTLAGVQKVRQSAARMSDQNSMRQTALGVINYAETNGHYPHSHLKHNSPAGALSESPWLGVLPYIEGQNVANAYNKNAPYFDSTQTPSNFQLGHTNVKSLQFRSLPGSGVFPGQSDIVFVAPEAPQNLDTTYGTPDMNRWLIDSGYPPLTGIGQVDRRTSPATQSQPTPKVTILDVTNGDGTSNTILLATARGTPITNTGDRNFEAYRWQHFLNPAYGIGSAADGFVGERDLNAPITSVQHRHGISVPGFVARADGGVVSWTQKIDPNVVKQLAGYRDGVPPGGFDR